MKYNKIFLAFIRKLFFVTTITALIIIIIKLPQAIRHSDGVHSIGKIIKIGNLTLDFDYKSLYLNSIDYIKVLLSGSLGKTTKNVNVSHYILSGLPRSLILLISGLIFSIVIGISKGIFDSKKEKYNTSIFRSLFTLIFSSMPDVFIIVFLQVSMVWLHKRNLPILPVAGGDSIKHLILPIISLSIIPATYISRITTLSLDEVFENGYIKTAIGKGASKIRVIWIHGFSNVIVDIIGSFSSLLTIIISTLLLVEYIFAYPGIAYMMYVNYISNESNAVIGLALTLGVIYLCLDIIFSSIKYLLISKKS